VRAAGALLFQLQGGRVPSEQSTTVLESAGTITVVVLAGGGLLLLMQPDIRGAITIKLASSFTGLSR
jgi:hypothetical protein